MQFKEILNRLTGISVPIFGVSWSPAPLETEVARKTLDYLADRRVLFNPYEFEDAEACITSVRQMREFLSERIAEVPSQGELRDSLRALRASCRRFLDRAEAVWTGKVQARGGGVRPDSDVGIVLGNALGELRGAVGVQVARVAALHGLDLESSLADIIPAAAGDDV